MSAGRNASVLLFTLVSTIVLFGVFAGVSSLNVLEKHAYVPASGWQQPADTVPGLHGVCGPTTVTSGFPLAYKRQAETPVNCLWATNAVAMYVDYALYFAAAAIMSVGLAESVKNRL